jgi:hypothetical protein
MNLFIFWGDMIEEKQCEDEKDLDKKNERSGTEKMNKTNK